MSSVLAGLDHGLDFTNRYCQAWFFGLPLTYITLMTAFRRLNWWNFKLKVMKGGKLVDSNTRASDDMAFEIVAGFCVAYLAAAGIIGTFSLFGVDELSHLKKDPFYAESAFVVNHLCYPMFFYQAWNIVLCLNLDVLSDKFMIAHHTLTAILSYMALAPYLQHLALFFFGIVEITSVPLTIYDVCKKFDRLGWKDTLMYHVSRITFAVSYIVIRLILWPMYSWGFWAGSISLLQSGKGHSNLTISFFLVTNVFMTGLQLMWGQQIISALLLLVGYPAAASAKV